MRLFVGSLSFNTSESTLAGLFEQYGADSVNIITDRETGRSRGFGFVEIRDDEAAKKAIAEQNGVELDGRQIQVNQARERDDRGGGGGGRSRRW